MVPAEVKMKQYKRLIGVLQDAMEQAAEGKGSRRHVVDEVPFEDQISCWLERRGYDYARGQAVKKIDESLRMDAGPAIQELRGAINFIAIAIIAIQDELTKNPSYIQWTNRLSHDVKQG